MNIYSELHEISKLYELPEFVKQAEFEDASLSELPFSAFADKDRQYPIHTKAACYLSNARFWNRALRQESNDVELGKSLLKWASTWAIEPEVARLAKQAAGSLQDGNLQDDDFALVHGETRSYPIDSIANIEKSSENFYRDRNCYPYEMRKAAAERFLKAAAEKLAALYEPGYFLRASGDARNIDKEALVSSIMERAALLRNTEFDNLVGYLAKGAKQLLSSDLTKEAFVKSSEMLDTIDRRTGLFHKYATTLSLPEEVSTDAFSKQAQTPQTIKLASGSTISMDELRTRGPEIFQAMPSYNVSSHGQFDLQKAAAVVANFSVKEAAFFERLVFATA